MQPLQDVPIEPRSTEPFADLVGAADLATTRRRAAELAERLQRRIVWNVNSTAAGGGVAELLHTLLAYARGLGIDARWTVVSGTPEFFRITKRLHNALHGEVGDGSSLGHPERRIYERVMLHNAAPLCERFRPGDVVILHDPQTAGLIPYLAGRGVSVIWRCHVGNDWQSAEGDLAWDFLGRYLGGADAFVFSRFAYVPAACDHGRSIIVPPSIDPFSAKNQEMDDVTVRAVLAHIGVIRGEANGGPRSFSRGDGSRARVERAAEILRDGPPPRPDAPLVVQVSRWDRLKDPIGVLEGFRRSLNGNPGHLVLAGPSVAAVADDPEGAEVFDEVVQHWRGLAPEMRSRVHLVNLPMDDLEENAAMVNALQRHATVVVQKSLREGFGLTVTEAMWKARPLVASAVGGIQDQVEHGVSGLLVRDPLDLNAFGAILYRVLTRPTLAARLGANARRRVTLHYLGLRSLLQFGDIVERVDHERERPGDTPGRAARPVKPD
jgi:trehalose synthase